MKHVLGVVSMNVGDASGSRWASLGSGGIRESLMVRPSLGVAHLPSAVLKQMMAKLVQQYVKSREVPQPGRFGCRLFVEKDLARCSGLAVENRSAVEVLGLPQLDDA